MSVRPRLAVLAVLAAGGTAFGGYDLWPNGRHIASCAPKHAPVPAAAQAVLARYAHRIEHSVERNNGGRRTEMWDDPDTGRWRQLSFDTGRRLEAGLVPGRDVAHMVFVTYDARTWTSERERLFPSTTTNVAASMAQATRDKVADGKAAVVGRAAVDGHQTLHLRELVHLPAPTTPPGAHLPKAFVRDRLLHVDTWADALTYLPVRIRTSGSFGWSVADTTWLPRTPATVAKTRVVIPPGFKRLAQNGSVTSYADFSTSRCSQS
jgi:hypothetical protein